jgi:ribose-phosphate pyrophosphokinase
VKYILTDSVRHFEIRSIKVEKGVFPDGELWVRIKNDLSGEPVVIISNIMSDNILEFLFIVDAARRAGARIKGVVVPFMSYARQDQPYVKGESVSGAVICSILRGLKIPVVVFDVHSLRLRKYFNFRNVSLLPMLVGSLPKRNWVVVSPDLGGVERAKVVAKILKAPMIAIKKTRKNGIGMRLDKKLPKKDVLIVEDMVSTGETLLKAVKILRKNGAGDIYCISTHGLFVKGARAKLLKSGIKRIFVSNSIDVKGSGQIRVKKVDLEMINRFF